MLFVCMKLLPLHAQAPQELEIVIKDEGNDSSYLQAADNLGSVMLFEVPDGEVRLDARLEDNRPAHQVLREALRRQ